MSINEKIMTIVILFVISVFSFNVGFASENEKQIITNYDRFNIEFNDVKIVSYDGINPKETNATISSNYNDISLNISDMEYPGAYVEFEIKVINNGNIDAKIEQIIVSGFENSNVIKYRILNAGELYNSIIESGESKTIYLIIEWDKNATFITEECLNFNIQIPVCSEIG